VAAPRRRLTGDKGVTQRNIEQLIGRLLTDEDFRETFMADPEQSLRELLERGTHLTPLEIEALVAIDPKLWRQTAKQIDARLQKARLKWPLIDEQELFSDGND
jgi:hypothetical protein